MTNRTIPEGAAEGFCAELRHQEGQAARASVLLRHATETLEAAPAAERPEDKAQRLRGVAVLLHTAALEVAVTCGWLEATEAAARHDLVEVKP